MVGGLGGWFGNCLKLSYCVSLDMLFVFFGFESCVFFLWKDRFFEFYGFLFDFSGVGVFVLGFECWNVFLELERGCVVF